MGKCVSVPYEFQGPQHMKVNNMDLMNEDSQGGSGVTISVPKDTVFVDQDAIVTSRHIDPWESFDYKNLRAFEACDQLCLIFCKLEPGTTVYYVINDCLYSAIKLDRIPNAGNIRETNEITGQKQIFYPKSHCTTMTEFSFPGTVLEDEEQDEYVDYGYSQKGGQVGMDCESDNNNNNNNKTYENESTFNFPTSNISINQKQSNKKTKKKQKKKQKKENKKKIKTKQNNFHSCENKDNWKEEDYDIDIHMELRLPQFENNCDYSNRYMSDNSSSDSNCDNGNIDSKKIVQQGNMNESKYYLGRSSTTGCLL